MAKCSYRILPLIVAIAAAFALCACASPAAPNHPSAKTPATGPAPRELTDAEKGTLYDAEQELIKSCMQRKGFKIWVTKYAKLPHDPQFPYVLDNVAWAKAHGYGSDQRKLVEAVRTNDPNTKYFNSLSAEERTAATAAFNGSMTSPRIVVTTPDGMSVSHSNEGCMAEAEQELYGDFAAWYREKKVVESLTPLWAQRVLNDPEFVRAVSEWARCMRNAGYDYTTPENARSGALSRDNPMGHTGETSTAVAEATCANKTPLSQTSRRLDRRYRTLVYGQYQSDVSRYQQLQLSALSRIRTAIKYPN